MSDYGPPAGQYGGPPGPPPGPPGATKAPMSKQQQTMILTYAGAGLGLLGFIWGFLDWLSVEGGGSGASGYASVGGAAIGLGIAAGLIAAAGAFEKKPASLTPVAVAVAGLLCAFGVLVNHGSGISAGIGLILLFITAILQVAALAVAWLMENGKIAGLKPKPQQSSWPSPGQQPGQQQQPGQYGGYPSGPQQQYGPPPGYGGPPQGQPPQGPPPQGPPPQGPQGQPPQGPPPQAPPPSYRPPQHESSTQQIPSVGYGQPQERPAQEGPPSGYGQ